MLDEYERLMRHLSGLNGLDVHGRYLTSCRPGCTDCHYIERVSAFDHQEPFMEALVLNEPKETEIVEFEGFVRTQRSVVERRN